MQNARLNAGLAQGTDGQRRHTMFPADDDDKTQRAYVTCWVSAAIAANPSGNRLLPPEILSESIFGHGRLVYTLRSC